MVELTPKSAADGLLPITFGSVTVTEITNLPLTSLAPRKGADAKLALKELHRLDWPDVGHVTGDQVRLAWFGHGHVMLMGTHPHADLAQTCAVTDQTDAWCVVDVSGIDAVATLARLTPLDLRDNAFAAGQVARTDVQHMHGAILRMSQHTYRVMVFRSMARTLVHDLKCAMQRVAALKA